MWSSRDLALVIITAIIVLFFSIFFFQIGTENNISVLNYVIIPYIGMAFLVSLTFLLFEGRKWRFFIHNILVALITFPTFPYLFVFSEQALLGGKLYDVFPRLIIVLAGFLADLILNRTYKNYKNSNRLFLWSILTGLLFFLILPCLQILIVPIYSISPIHLFYLILVISPYIIGGAIVGGSAGYIVYRIITYYINN